MNSAGPKCEAARDGLATPLGVRRAAPESLTCHRLGDGELELSLDCA